MAERPETIKSPSPSLVAAGTKVDHFEIIEMIGSGGMGEVYLAKDTLLSRKVALKIVRSKAFDDQDALDRFLYEAKITARFNHPNIVTAYSVGEHEGHPYVALEYIEGDTLRQRMDRERIEPRDCIEIGLAIARALAEAHSHHILHRDLKPENVAIPSDGRVRVLDFGLARALPRQEMALAATADQGAGPTVDSLVAGFQEDEGGFSGTPYYMSPEQWQAEPASEASDVWALGVILYEMLAGERPFAGPTIFVLGAKVVSNDPSPQLPSAGDEGYPRGLSELLRECLDKDAPKRPSARELVRKLEGLLSGDDRKTSGQAGWLTRVLGVLIVVTVIAMAAIVWSQWGKNRWHEVESPDADVDPISQLLSERFPPRMTSSRPLLRLGSSELSSILGSAVSPAIFWGLMYQAPDGREVVVMSRERPTLDNGGVRPAPDGGLEVTWRLLPGLKWSDGRAFTASDLVFGLEVFPPTDLIEAEASDDRTLVMRWSDRVVEALGSVRPLPRHVLASVFQEGGTAAVEDYLRLRPTPVMGPYRVIEFVPDDRMVLASNPHFVGPAPSIRRVELIRARPDDLIDMYEAGRIDVILPDVLSLQQAERMVKLHPEAVHIRPSSTLMVLQPDMDHRFLGKLEVRKALMHAVNRARLVTEVFQAEGRIAHVPQQAPLPIGVEIYQYDPAAARAALKQAGAESMSLLLIHGPSETERQIASLLERDLEAVGVDLQTTPLVQKSLRTLERGCRHGGLVLDRFPVSRRQSPLPFLNLPRSRGGYDLTVRHDGFDDRMAALIKRESRSLVAERRSELRDSIWGLWSDRLPMLPLAFAAERAVVNPSLRGWDARRGVRFGRGLAGWYFVAGESEER